MESLYRRSPVARKRKPKSKPVEEGAGAMSKAEAERISQLMKNISIRMRLRNS